MSDTPPMISPRVTEAYTPARPRRITSVLRSWARSTFSRESLVASLKSLAWVAPLTVLIWIYAEREHVIAEPNIAFRAQIHNNDSGRDVRLEPGGDVTIHAELTGPMGEVETVKDLLESKGAPIEIERDLQPGFHEIQVAAELNRLPEVESHGVTVSNCVPAEIQVFIDPMREYRLEVKVRPEDEGRLAAPPIFTPSFVRAVGPESQMDKAKQAAKAAGRAVVAYADLAPLQEQLAEAGQHKFPSVRVNPSSDLTGMRVTLVPSTVSAVVEARGPEASTTLPGVPVLAASPVVETAERFKIVVDESTATLPSIKVFGPQEKIDLLKSGKFSPAAIFRPDYTIPQGTTAEAPIIYFDLPPGVHASPSDLVRYSIRYTVQPRKSPDQ